MKRKMSAFLLAAGLILGLTACGADKENTVFTPKLPTDTRCSLKVAGSYSNFEALESEFDRFYEYYPNVSLSYVNLDDYNNTIVSALMGEEAPDIFTTASWMTEDAKMAPLFENAEILSDPTLNIDLNCFRKGVLRVNDNGDVVMLPVFTRSFGMLVNMDIFEKNGLKVPEDYGSLVKTCEKLRAAGYEHPIMGANTTTTSGAYYAFAVPMFCAEVMNNKEKLDALNSMEGAAGELMRSSLARLMEFMDLGYYDRASCTAQIEDDYNAVIMRFFEGDVPMMLGSGDMVSGTAKRESKSEAFSANPFKYRFFVVPAGDEGGYFLDTVNMYFTVNKNSKNLEMTNEFIRFLTSEKELGNMAAIKRLITPTNDFSVDAVYSSLEGFDQDRTISYQETGISDAVNTEFRIACYKVANGEMTVDEAVAAFGTLSGE